MKKLPLFLLFYFLIYVSTIGQSVCNKNIIVWNFNIGSSNDKLAHQIANEVENAIISTRKSYVLERNRYNEIINILQNEQNLCYCPQDLVQSTIKQLKDKRANEVVFGEIGKDEYYGEVYLELTFVNLNNLVNDKSEKIHFSKSVFNDSKERAKIIQNHINKIFVCDRLAEEIDKIAEEINIEKNNLQTINNNLEKEYESRMQLDNYLLADKKIKRDHPQLEVIHKSIKSLKAEKNDAQGIIKQKELEYERLFKIQKEKQIEETARINQSDIDEGLTEKNPPKELVFLCANKIETDCLERTIIEICVSEFDEKFADKYFVQAASLKIDYEPCHLQKLMDIQGEIYLVDNGDDVKEDAKYAIRIGPFSSKKDARPVLLKTRRTYRKDAELFSNGRLIK